MFLHQWANLDWNVYRACDLWHMYHDSKLSPVERGMNIRISAWHTFDIGCVSSPMVAGWHRWWSGQMWRQFWCQLSESLWWRCTMALAPPACLGIQCCAILARNTAMVVIFPKHSQVYFHRSLHIFWPMNLNGPLLLFSDSSVMFHD